MWNRTSQRSACVCCVLKCFALLLLLLIPEPARGQSGTESLAAAQQAIAFDDYEFAHEHLRKGMLAARAAGDMDLLAEVQDTKKRATMLEREFTKLKGSRLKLLQNPEDGEANTLLGRFYTFAKEDWTQGLPMLASGDDEALRMLAVEELNQPQDRDAQLKLGTAWLDAAAANRDPQVRDQMFLLARKWLWSALDLSADESERQAVCELLDRVKLNPSKVIIYNTHNGPKNNRGTRLLDVTLLLDEKPVFQRRITMIWKPDVSAPNIIRLTGRMEFNQVKMTVLKWEGFGGGLAELEVYQGNSNLALDALATGDSSPETRCRPSSLTDGNLGALTDQNGLWMLSNSTTGTVVVHLNRR
jgi:hypothetical protein